MRPALPIAGDRPLTSTSTLTTMPSTAPAAQRLVFALADVRERVLGLAAFQPWDPAARYLSAILRLPPDAARALAGALPPSAVAGHHLYPPATLHLTLLNLDRWAGRAGPPALAAALETLAGAGPVTVALHGLGRSRLGVYARAFSPDGSLLRLRHRLATALGAPPAGDAGHEPALALLPVGFVNLLRFRSPPGAPVQAAVWSARRFALGPIALGELEWVRTDRLLSPEHTERLGRVALG